jgi:hypothetical protein
MQMFVAPPGFGGAKSALEDLSYNLKKEADTRW